MDVDQKFTIKFRRFPTIFVTYGRAPNGNGSIYDLAYWSEDSIYPAKLFLEKNELTKEEQNAIHIRAAKLWDDYFTVDNICCAVEWLRGSFSPLRFTTGE